MLTWEGTQVLGAANIGNKLENLPFQRIVHKVNTVDAQPSSAAGNALMVIVTGQLLIDDEKNPHHFTQAFQLVAEGQAYFVFNDVFRLNYG
ncbi:nuclear transport factor 2 [Gonapodya prolifera JEL478]|uniref:Nuclear transport factor 2 n=1 Tax=Gonapodya prolifera (strain JEL478) TaxID=1344416 RepID=A0A139AW85_GONPJ|nr:nuclear transport factor 2 [Gonapodya prolifera JEL478]|eukprot:KXS20996.1 nuclear transport factor 2 [Gonapodya prolifera JEL478]